MLTTTTTTTTVKIILIININRQTVPNALELEHQAYHNGKNTHWMIEDDDKLTKTCQINGTVS